MNSGKRVYYWDNLRALLIFLVVLGHFLLPIHKGRGIVDYVYYFIYLFHMPAFIFVSGFFSKSFVRKFKAGDPAGITTLLAYLIIYVVFQYMMSGLHYLCSGNWNIDLYYVEGTPWYMLSMAGWLILVLLFEAFDWKFAIPLAIAFALWYNPGNKADIFLSMTRTVVLFPFFLTGYYFDYSLVEKARKRFSRFALLVPIAAFGLVYFKYQAIQKYAAIIYSARSYVSIPTTLPMAVLLRLGWIIGAAGLTFAIMLLIPDKKLPVSAIGSNTLGIYIFHRLLRQLFTEFNWYDALPSNRFLLLFACILLSLLCCMVFSNRYINTLVRLPFRIRLSRLFRRQ